MPVSDVKIREDVLEQAADYYLGLQDGTISGADLHAWQDWLAEHEDHRRAFSRMETLWGVLELATEEDIAALPGDDIPAYPADVQAEGGDNVLSILSPARQPGRILPKLSAGWMGGIAATFLAALIATSVMFSNGDNASQAAATLYQTAAGQQRVVKLADGSIVELNADSAIAVEYSEEERNLTLERGQAIFTVAKNPKRPFVVKAGRGSVTAIGTVFNVRKTSADVEVHVLEGTVAVRPGAGAGGREEDAVSGAVALVTAGSQTSYSSRGVMTPVVHAPAQKDMAWRVGVLTMVDLPISDVIADLNRYLANEITIGDEAVGAMRFTGTVYPDQVQAWLEGLQEGYPIEVVRLGSSTILMMAGESSDTVVREASE